MDTLEVIDCILIYETYIEMINIRKPTYKECISEYIALQLRIKNGLMVTAGPYIFFLRPTTTTMTAKFYAYIKFHVWTND